MGKPTKADAALALAREALKRGHYFRLRIHAGGRLDFENLLVVQILPAAALFKLVRAGVAACVSRETAVPGRFDLIVRSAEGRAGE